jgi:hypothetical protein
VRHAGGIADLVHLGRNLPELAPAIDVFESRRPGLVGTNAGAGDQIDDVLELGALARGEERTELVVGVGLGAREVAPAAASEAGPTGHGPTGYRVPDDEPRPRPEDLTDEERGEILKRAVEAAAEQVKHARARRVAAGLDALRGAGEPAKMRGEPDKKNGDDRGGPREAPGLAPTGRRDHHNAT